MLIVFLNLSSTTLQRNLSAAFSVRCCKIMLFKRILLLLIFGSDMDMTESEVLMEECLSQLTALMDIPMLESILQVILLSMQLGSSSTSAAAVAVENSHAINRRMLSRFESIAVIMSEQNWR